VPRRGQPVEKVVVGPIGTLKQLQYTSKPVQNTTKPGFKALEQGSENNTREFFNTLGFSRKSIEVMPPTLGMVCSSGYVAGAEVPPFLLRPTVREVGRIHEEDISGAGFGGLSDAGGWWGSVGRYHTVPQ
jgi:hypothetical protein